MKTVPEKLEIKYHQTVGQGTITTPGHSTLAEAAVVLAPQHFAPEGEVLGEHIDHVLHENPKAGHIKAHAEAGHMGKHFAHHTHETIRKEGEAPGHGGHEGYRHHEEDHPHKLRGDHAKHNPMHHQHKGKHHKNPHE